MQLNTSSNKYLEEAKVRPVVLTFGRFQPPTVGHQLLITSVIKIAKKRGGEHRIYTSRTQDSKKNPLPLRDKIKFLRKFFPNANIVDDRSAITIFSALHNINEEGHKHVILVVGSDRVADFKTSISKYIGPDKLYQFDKFEVLSAGNRDPEAEGVTGMSASKMRMAASTNNFDNFKLGMPANASKKDVEAVWNSLRRNMKLNESTSSVKTTDWVTLLWEDYIENDNDPLGDCPDEVVRYQPFAEVLTRQQRRNISKAAKRTAGKRSRSRKMKAKRKKGTQELKSKAFKQARMLLKKKISKDVDWNTASVSTKERIDKMLAKKKGLIAKISKKLMPGVRKAETERIAQLKSKTDESVEILREPEILDRLVKQLMDKGKSKDAAYAIANSQLQKNGVTKKGSTKLTKHGKKRNSMTAGERAKDRAAKKDGKSASGYNYNAKTNTATQKESVELDERRKDVYAIVDKKGKVVSANLTNDNSHKESSNLGGQRKGFTIVLDPDAKVGDVLKTFARKESVELGEAESLNWNTLNNNEREDFLNHAKMNKSLASKKWKQLSSSEKSKLARMINKTTGGEFALFEDEVEEGVKVDKFLKKIKMRKFDRDERKRKKDNHKKIMKYQKMVGITAEVEVEEERDYKKEYANFHGKPEQRAKRSKRVLARRKLEAQGRVSKGDGKDVDHKDGNANNNSDGNLRVMNRSTNRSRNNNKQRHEEHGAGEEGTDALLKKLKKDTPFS